MEKSETAELLVGLLREQLEEVDKLVRYLSSLSDGAEIEPDLEEWFNRWVDSLDHADRKNGGGNPRATLGPE